MWFILHFPSHLGFSTDRSCSYVTYTLTYIQIRIFPLKKKAVREYITIITHYEERTQDSLHNYTVTIHYIVRKIPTNKKTALYKKKKRENRENLRSRVIGG